MQKFMHVDPANKKSMEAVNSLLEDGWKVIDMKCAGSGGSYYVIAFLVLEKVTQEELAQSEQQNQ